MPCQNVPVALRLLSLSGIQPDDSVAIFQNDIENLGEVVERAIGGRPTLETRFPPNVTSATALLESTKRERSRATRAPCPSTHTVVPQRVLFHVLICVGRPHLTAATALARSLRIWSNSILPGGRVLVEMFRQNGETQGTQWSSVERRYQDAVNRAGFVIKSINGIDRDQDLPTTVIDLYASVLSLSRVVESPEYRAWVTDEMKDDVTAYRKDLSTAATTKGKAVVDTILSDFLGQGCRLFAVLQMV